MKKEKQVRTYQRRTKSGKTVTVRAHTAKYDAAMESKEAAKKKGAGDELSKLKDKKSNIYEGYDFTKEEFNEWYEGTGSEADKKVDKILRKQLGRKAYAELNDLAADSYKKGGAGSFFKSNVHSKKDASTGFGNNKNFKANFPKELHKYLDSGNFSLKGKPTKEVTKAFKDAGFDIRHNSVEGFYAPVDSKTGRFFGEISPEQVNRNYDAHKAKIKSEQADVVKWAKEHDYVALRDGGFVPRSEYKKSNWRSISADELRKQMKAKDKPSKGKPESKSLDLSTHEGQVSYVRSRVKELPEESRKLNKLLRQWGIPVPWDKSDMAHSD